MYAFLLGKVSKLFLPNRPIRFGKNCKHLLIAAGIGIGLSKSIHYGLGRDEELNIYNYKQEKPRQIRIANFAFCLIISVIIGGGLVSLYLQKEKSSS